MFFVFFDERTEMTVWPLTLMYQCMWWDLSSFPQWHISPAFQVFALCQFQNECPSDVHYPKYLDISTPYYICSKIWTIYYLMCLKIAGWVANSVDPDETLGLHCLLRPVCLNTYDKYSSKYWREWMDTSSTSHELLMDTIEDFATIFWR